jgi:hypothetical protein
MEVCFRNLLYACRHVSVFDIAETSDNYIGSILEKRVVLFKLNTNTASGNRVR